MIFFLHRIRAAARKNPRSFAGTVVAVGLFLLFLALPLLSPITALLIPARVERHFGELALRAMESDKEFCQGEDGLRALRSLVQRLEPHAKAAHRIKVFVANEEIANAFAAPGGTLVIFRGLIDKAESGNEVAGVLAHELAHEAEGHTSQLLAENLGYGIYSLMVPGGGLGRELGRSLVHAHYSRGDELDADRRGVELLKAAGIASDGYLKFFDRMVADGEDIPGGLEFLSTHPTGERRRQALAELATPGEPALSAVAWTAVREVCARTGPLDLLP